MKVTPTHMAFSAICFDLDGTLIDPGAGFAQSLRHACSRLAIPSPPLEELLSFIGPPIQQTFAELLRTDDKQAVDVAVGYYREHYSTIGLFECDLYGGIEPLLRALQAADRRFYLATSKPTVFARPILERFRLDNCFTGIYGSELDGTRTNKADLLAHLLNVEGLSAKRVVMVGDRKQDIVGARKNGIATIGVTYGFGSATELTDAGADQLCHSPEQLLSLLLSLSV